MSQNPDPNLIDWVKWPPPSQKDEDVIPIVLLSNAYATHVFNRKASIDEVNGINAIYDQIYEKVKTFTELRELLNKAAERKIMDTVDNVFVAPFDKLTKMFDQEYLEKRVVTDFCNYIMRHAKSWKNTTHLAPYAAMIQSSGTGKTRLIKESGDFMWLFYICCRHDKSTGFPRRSAIIPELLGINSLANISHQTAGVLLTLHILFLAACLSQVLDFISHIPIPKTPGQLPRAIDQKYFAKFREMQLQGTETEMIGSEFWKKILSRLDSLVKENMPELSTGLSMPTEQQEKGFIAQSQQILETIADSVQYEISRRCSDKNCVLFAFDEAHQLMLKEMLGTTNSFFLIRRALSKFPNAGMCFVSILVDLSKQIS